MFMQVKVHGATCDPYILVNSKFIACVTVKERAVLTLVLSDGTNIDIESTFEEVFNAISPRTIKSPKLGG